MAVALPASRGLRLFYENFFLLQVILDHLSALQQGHILTIPMDDVLLE